MIIGVAGAGLVGVVGALLRDAVITSTRRVNEVDIEAPKSPPGDARPNARRRKS